MADVRRITLTLYGRTWCHLCDDMITGLHEMQRRESFELTVTDVDSDPLLEQRYGERVPVLVHGNHELCHYHLNPAAITDYLLKFR